MFNADSSFGTICDYRPVIDLVRVAEVPFDSHLDRLTSCHAVWPELHRAIFESHDILFAWAEEAVCQTGSPRFALVSHAALVPSVGSHVDVLLDRRGYGQDMADTFGTAP